MAINIIVLTPTTLSPILSSNMSMSQPCDLIQLAQDMQVGLHAWWSVLGSCEPDSGTEALSHFSAKLRRKTKNKRQARQSSREDDFGQESTSIEGEATIRCHDAHAMQGGNNAIADGAQLSRNRQIVCSLMHSHVVQRLPSVPLRQSVRHDQLVLRHHFELSDLFHRTF